MQMHSIRGGRRLTLHIAAGSVSSNDFKTGMTIEFDGSPFKVVEFLHVKPGKGAAFVRSKLKNCITGNTIEKTWRAGETVEVANVDKKDSQYTYVTKLCTLFLRSRCMEMCDLPADVVSLPLARCVCVCVCLLAV